MGDPRAARMPLAEALARAAMPLAGLAAMAAFAAHEADPMAAAESGYLAAVATVVLAAVAFLAAPPAFEAGLGAVLATTAIWALPASPGRGAAVLLLLVATLAIAAGRRLARCPSELPLAVTVPLALGLQALLRGDLLLAPRHEPRIFGLLVVLPLAGALLASYLSRRHGWRAAVALGLALAATPGWTIATLLALLAFAGGDAFAATAGSSWRSAWPIRAAALAAIALPLVWGRGGWLAVAAGLTLASPALGLAGAAVLAVLSLFLRSSALATAVPALQASDVAGWSATTAAAAGSAALALLCVPAALAPGSGRRRWAAAGGLLAFAAPAFAPAGTPALAVLAAPLALLALATREESAATIFQRAWTAALLAGAALFAGYPWLREQPLAGFLALLGPAPLAALVAGLAIAAMLAAAARTAASHRSPESWAPAGIAASLLFLAILVHLPAPPAPLVADGATLRLAAGAASWEERLPAAATAPPARGVALVSTLENGGGLAAGTPVATLEVDDASGAPRRFTLAAGVDTAEWAARRADVTRALAARGERPPAAWVSSVAGGFFAQRYRRVFRLPAAARPARLRLALAPGLPPELALTVYRLEILH